MPRKRFTDSLVRSEGTKVSRFHISEKVRDQIFGAIPATVPEGNEENPLGMILNLLDEKGLLELNTKICELY